MLSGRSKSRRKRTGPGYASSPTASQAARRRLVSPGSADALEALGLVPGSFLADLHSRSPITASLSKALYELPCIDEIQDRFGKNQYSPPPRSTARTNSKERTDYIEQVMAFLNVDAGDYDLAGIDGDTSADKITNTFQHIVHAGIDKLRAEGLMSPPGQYIWGFWRGHLKKAFTLIPSI